MGCCSDKSKITKSEIFIKDYFETTNILNYSVDELLNYLQNFNIRIDKNPKNSFIFNSKLTSSQSDIKENSMRIQPLMKIKNRTNKNEVQLGNPTLNPSQFIENKIDKGINRNHNHYSLNLNITNTVTVVSTTQNPNTKTTSTINNILSSNTLNSNTFLYNKNKSIYKENFDEELTEFIIKLLFKNKTKKEELNRIDIKILSLFKNCCADTYQTHILSFMIGFVNSSSQKEKITKIINYIYKDVSLTIDIVKDFMSLYIHYSFICLNEIFYEVCFSSQGQVINNTFISIDLLFEMKYMKNSIFDSSCLKGIYIKILEFVTIKKEKRVKQVKCKSVQFEKGVGFEDYDQSQDEKRCFYRNSIHVVDNQFLNVLFDYFSIREEVLFGK